MSHFPAVEKPLDHFFPLADGSYDPSSVSYPSSSTPTHLPLNNDQVAQVGIAHLHLDPLPSLHHDEGRVCIDTPGKIVSMEATGFLTSVQDPRLRETIPFLPSAIPSSSQQAQEIEAFYNACLEDPIYTSLREEDKSFLKEVLIPNLLAAKYELMEEHRADTSEPSIMNEEDGPDLMDFRGLVNSAYYSEMLGIDSYFYKLLYLETDSTNTFHQDDFGTPSRTPMSVKIYPDGKIKFVIPLRRSMGSYKKVSHILHSHVDTPRDFKPLIKLSSHRDLEDQEYIDTQSDIEHEYRITQELDLPNFDRTSQVTTERVQLFATPQTALWDLVRPHSASLPPDQQLSVNQVVEKVDQLFEVAIELLHQINKIDKAGYVHNDIKPQNILVKKRIGASGSEHLVPLITDFGSTTPINQPGFRGTEGYYLEGENNGYASREKDLYALGKTFDQLLGLLFNNPDDPDSFKYDLSLLPIEQKVFVKTCIDELYKKFRELNEKMYATTIDEKRVKHYSNNISYSDLITAFSNLNKWFKEQVQGISL